MVYLEKRIPDQNQFRFYSLWLVPNLFGGWSLIREWGRIGSPGTLRVDSFDTQHEAQDALDKLAFLKTRRGYVCK